MLRIHRIVACTALAMVAVSCSSGGSPQPLSVPTTPKPGSHGSPSPSHSQKAVKPEKPVPVESNPPGDIPDNTAFVPYTSSKGHFVVKVPEGWSRKTSGSSVSFTDKLNTVSASWLGAAKAPTVQSAKAKDVSELKRIEPAFRLAHIIPCSPSCTIPYSTAPISVTLPGGPAMVITYEANSPRNQVTGKRYRLEVLRFEFYRAGREVALTLSGPVGSDNVDPWTLVTQSFRWR
jgi:hypothetical protein